MHSAMRWVRARLARGHGSGVRVGARRAGGRLDRGAATAEYAITMLAAVGFAGVLMAILRSGTVHSLLEQVVHRALNV
jgi:Protein of unknown function (DUF4244)